MWMWPLDSAIRATATHREPERVADGTCTRVWAWMTNKCRRRMNGREGYITTEITQSKKGKKKKKAQKKERGSWDARGVGSSRPRARCLSPWDVGPSNFVYFSPLKQVVASSEPQLLDHSLQIHCNGPGSKTKTLQLAPSMGKLLVQWWVQ